MVHKVRKVLPVIKVHKETKETKVQPELVLKAHRALRAPKEALMVRPLVK